MSRAYLPLASLKEAGPSAGHWPEERVTLASFLASNHAQPPVTIAGQCLVEPSENPFRRRFKRRLERAVLEPLSSALRGFCMLDGVPGEAVDCRL